jgi:drug/metabolite transporter (DMT)-like permease
MSIVAPISATSVLIPFAVGLAAGERPSLAQLAGTAVAATGVLLVASESARRGEAVGAPALPGGPAIEPEIAASASASVDDASDRANDRARDTGVPPGPQGTPAERRRSQRRAIGLSLLAAACIGLTLLGYDAAAQHDPMWAMLAGRASSATFIGLFLVATRPRIVATAAALPGIVTVGLADTGANGLFALATTQGYLSIVAVLGSVYPAVTVLLAFAFLHERIAHHQFAGVVATLAGVSLIAAG